MLGSSCLQGGAKASQNRAGMPGRHDKCQSLYKQQSPLQQPHLSVTLTDLTAGTSEAWRALAAEAVDAVDAGGSILARVRQTLIHI